MVTLLCQFVKEGGERGVVHLIFEIFLPQNNLLMTRLQVMKIMGVSKQVYAMDKIYTKHGAP